MADLILCAVCGQPATVYNHANEQPLCDGHNGGFNEPLAQADTMPWTETRLKWWREQTDRYRAAKEGELHEWHRSRWFATLDAERAKVAALIAALPTCFTCKAPATSERWWPDVTGYYCEKHRDGHTSDAPWRDVLLSLLPAEPKEPTDD